MRSFLMTSGLLLSLAGCTLIPAYERPKAPVTDAYRAPPVATDPAAATNKDEGVTAESLGWRGFFVDPVMQDLIALSLANNRDLRVAALNVSAAQAQYGAQHAALFPKIDAAAAAEYQRLPPAESGAPTALRTHSFTLGLSTMSYELDLFGRIRSLSKQAQESYFASAYTRLSTQISLISQVASTYLAWLADRDAIRVSTETAAAQERSFDLRVMTLSQGSGTALDVAQSETGLRTAQASLEQYSRQAALDYDALVLLCGTPIPPALEARMMAQQGLAAEADFPALSAGLPATLLERRPDIRAAEHSLLAANANIGAARAAFFPSVSLTANAGTASTGLNKLFGGGTAYWLFQPQVSVPIFDGGANKANLDYSKLEKRVEIANYEKAIQSAFRDVSDALAARATYVRQVQAQQKLVDADDRYHTMSKMRFDAGIDNYLNVLVAQSSLFAAQLALVTLELGERQNLVTLFKALGGGWSEKG